jgi:hypothetical protein
MLTTISNTMIKGEYKVDTDRTRIFYMKGLFTAIKISVAVCLVFVSSILLNYHSVKDIYLAIGIAVFCFIFTLALLMVKQGEGTFEKTRIIIEDTRVIKFGKDLRTVIIDYKDIGRVIKGSSGIVIVKRGFWPIFNFYFRYSRAKDPLTDLNNVIFIPIMIQDFERIKRYFVNKEYLLFNGDNNQA